MPATFAPFKHEAASTVAEELGEETGRGDVEIGREALFLELASLVGTSPRDQDERRFRLQDRRNLFLAMVGRKEPEDARTPGLTSERFFGLGEQGSDLASAHHCQG